MPGRRRTEAGRAAAEARSVEWVITGRGLARGKLQPIEVGVGADGRIARVGRDVRGARRVDLGDRILLPSAIDLHVHFRDPGPPGSAEEFATGTLQAALGGVGLVGDMPNTTPPVTSREHLEAKTSRAHGRAAVDLLLYALAMNPAQVDAVRHAAGAFKLYLAPTSGVDRPPLATEVPALLNAVRRTGLALSVHAEDPAGFRSVAPPHDPREWNDMRPSAAEMRAVRNVVRAPDGVRLHFAHTTTAAAVREVRRAGFSCETTPQHLLLDDGTGADPRFKVNPPLRGARERQELWDAFASGEVPILASDHAPHPVELKEQPFPEAPSGMPGVETMLPLLLAKVRDDALGLGTLVSASATRPALWLGVPQGRIAAGYRANVIAVDFRDRRRIRADDLHAPCGWSAFEGWEATFPTDHFLDGQRIVEDHEYVGTPVGRVLRPEYAT